MRHHLPLLDACLREAATAHERAVCTEQQTVLGWSLYGVQARDRRWPTTRPPALGCSLACRVCCLRLWQANNWLPGTSPFHDQQREQHEQRDLRRVRRRMYIYNVLPMYYASFQTAPCSS